MDKKNTKQHLFRELVQGKLNLLSINKCQKLLINS